MIEEIRGALANSPNWEKGEDSIKSKSDCRLELTYDNNDYDITVTKLCPNCGEEMDFGSAIRCLKRGMKVARNGWHAKDKYLWYVPPTTYRLPQCHDTEFKTIAEWNGGEIKGTGYVCMYLTEKGMPLVLKGWMPTPCDMLSDDWVVIG